MKLVYLVKQRYITFVAPLAGAWIEIAGAGAGSLPLRERGLKFIDRDKAAHCTFVAPLAGAWIEIPEISLKLAGGDCRSPCGSVD